MSDHDAAPDPMDKVYAQAEAVLDDEAARAARRARVLGAVARESQAPPRAASTPSRSRLSWGRGGWLAAASVAGLSAFLVLRLYLPTLTPHELPAATAAADAVASAPAVETATAPAPAVARPAPMPAPTAPVAMRAGPRAPRDVPADAAPPPPPPPLQVAPPPPPAAPPASKDASETASEVVVTGSRVAPPAARAASAASEAHALASAADGAARLRAAAAAGRTAELKALLAQGAAVDAPDDEGETALMKAVQENHPAAAALLRRHGASLDLRNRAGVSARDMAASIDDPKLNRALALVP